MSSMFENKGVEKTVFEVGKLYCTDTSKIKFIVANFLGAENVFFDMKNHKTSYHFWVCKLRVVSGKTPIRQKWVMHGSTYETQDYDALVFDFNSYLYLGTAADRPGAPGGRNMFLCEDKFVVFNLPGTAPYVLKAVCENS